LGILVQEAVAVSYLAGSYKNEDRSGYVEMREGYRYAPSRVSLYVLVSFAIQLKASFAALSALGLFIAGFTFHFAPAIQRNVFVFLIFSQLFELR